VTVNHPVPGSSPGGGVNGLEYIRAHISERKKNRKPNPCEREVGSFLMPVSSILQDRIDVLPP